jgi:histidyl-tRNA synthetase
MADKKPNKPPKLKARLPRGLADRGPAEIAATRHMVEAIRVVFERYGFEPVETPTIEYTDALGKFLPDQDRPNEGVFSFQDDDEQWLSLRYDLTAPLTRHVAERVGTENFVLPYRSYRYGWVFRNEKPGPGRFRQFMQFDADTVGSASMAADAEMCMLAADTMEELGIKRGDYVVKVNNRKVLDGIMESIGIGGIGNAGKRLTVLRAIDKLDRLGPDAVRMLLGKGRKDESGDFTKGAELPEHAIDAVVGFLSTAVNNNEETFSRLESLVSGSNQGIDGVVELRGVAELIAASGYDDGRVRIDTSVVRGLEYYTGPVYEVELTFEIDDEKGRPIRFGSVGGGGRYDGLRCRRPAFPSASRACRRRSPRSGSLATRWRPAPWSSLCSTRTASPTTSAWCRLCAPPTSARSSISAIRRTSATSSNMPTSVAAPASSSRAATRKPKTRSLSRT